MFLEIITPDKTIFEGDVKLVELPGSKGRFVILHNHAPVISTLDEGTVRAVKINGEELRFKVDGGVVENKSNKIVVLVESA
ncbi:MAG: ATP synthase F1 subunit epsilon [Prolixibacteraceae bacterium]